MTLRKRHKILPAALGVLGLVFIAWFFLSGISRHPRLALSFLSETNNSGRTIAFFAVTNNGNSSAITPATTSGYGIIEIVGKMTNAAVFRSSHHRLLPGEGEIIQVILPTNSNRSWRYTAFYAQEGPRSTIYDLQWGSHRSQARSIGWCQVFSKGCLWMSTREATGSMTHNRQMPPSDQRPFPLSPSRRKKVPNDN